VNKEKVPLLSELKNGDIVKIITSDEVLTRCSWLDAVKTSRAKTNMRTNCNARIKEINFAYAVNMVATAMNLNHSRVEEWFEKNRCEGQANIPCDLDHYKNVVGRYIQDIGSNGRFRNFLSRNRFKLKSKVISSIEVSSVTNVNDIVFDYCCHPKSGDEIMGFLDKNKVHVHHKMCEHAHKKLEAKEPMVFVRWEKKNFYSYSLIASLQNEKGALANFLTYLVKLNIDISSIELGKEKSNYVKYCELEFDSFESNIGSLRAKIEQKIKVIHLIRTDDAYR
jgi:GTP pyrophosphokinase